MAGYYGYSMSNNALEAYEAGERPLSRWTKAEILELIHSELETADFDKVPAPILKRVFLERSSWHHTSKLYNRTDFYDFDYGMTVERARGLVDRLEVQAQEAREKARDAAQEAPRYVQGSYTEWTGQGRRKRREEVAFTGIVKGGWILTYDGERKKASGNWIAFHAIEVQDARRAWKAGRGRGSVKGFSAWVKANA